MLRTEPLQDGSRGNIAQIPESPPTMILPRFGIVAAALFSIILFVAAAWLTTGLCIAIWLHSGRLARLDPGTAGAGIAFRILVTPGIMALWPLLLRNWRRHRRGMVAAPDAEDWLPAARLRARHGLIVRSVAVAVPVLCAAAIIARPAPIANGSPIPDALRTPPLAAVAEDRAPFLLAQGVAALIRTDERRSAWQLELAVTERPGIRGPMLYWFPPAGAGAASEYLGPVSAAGVHRFAISETMVREGSFAILSFRDATALGPARRGGG